MYDTKILNRLLWPCILDYIFIWKLVKKLWWLSFHHLNFVYHLIVSTKFNQLSRKTYANNIILIDNIDHNDTSSASSSHFHGTSISMFPHYDSLIEKENIHLIFLKLITKKKETLSYHYTIMILVLLMEMNVNAQFPQLMNISKNIIVNPVHDSLEWLKFVNETNSTNTKASEKSCNWAVRYQENIVQELQIPCFSVILPLINESINFPAMIKHCMTVKQKVVYKVNPGQIPIITADEPVYALLKQILSKFSNDFGEDAFIIMMGRLHIEMVMLHVLGLMLLGPMEASAINQNGHFWNKNIMRKESSENKTCLLSWLGPKSLTKILFIYFDIHFSATICFILPFLYLFNMIVL